MPFIVRVTSESFILRSLGCNECVRVWSVVRASVFVCERIGSLLILIGEQFGLFLLRHLEQGVLVVVAHEFVLCTVVSLYILPTGLTSAPATSAAFSFFDGLPCSPPSPPSRV